MWCRWVQRDLTALTDGELSSWRSTLVQRHLDGCATCRDVSASVEGTVRRQRELLPMLSDVGAIPIDAMLANVRRGAQRVQEPKSIPALSWLRPPVIAAAAAAAILLFGLVRWSEPLLVAAGLEDPPKMVAEKPDLFVDYTLFENFDTIEHLGRGSTPPGESRS